MKENATCKCSAESLKTASNYHIAKGVKKYGAILLSMLIAFFPKCPICWASYISVFGGIGLSHIAYQKWMLPVLIGFLLMHLTLLFRNIKVKGYGPLLISVAGFMILITSKVIWPEDILLLYSGISLITIGSLWNNYT
ncbi:hypothetical protein ACWKSR_10170, partial [Campylobacter fetus subsp. venerealis]